MSDEPDYDLTERVVESYGIPQKLKWEAPVATGSRMVFKNIETGVKLQLEQTKEDGGDLPYRVSIQRDANTNPELLSSHDYLGDAIQTIEVAQVTHNVGAGLDEDND